MLPRASIYLSVAAALTACGGSDDPNASSSYAGTWGSTCYAEGDSVYRYQESISLKSAEHNRMTYVGSLAMYSNANCSGAPDDVAEYVGAIELVGVKTVDSKSVNKANITPSEQEPIKTIFSLQEGDLYVGKKSGAVDADGYPAAIETAYRLIRQD